jgi:hypothetical protein
MTEHLEVIAALMDGERVDTRALKEALDTEDGPDYLVDLVALHELVDRETTVLATVTPRRRRMVTWLATAAAVVILAGGSYLLGAWLTRARLTESPSPALSDAAPAPTRVIEIQWTEVSGGR